MVNMKIKNKWYKYRLFKNNKYKYFQGNGCVKCRNTENNEEFITGIVNYIKEITDDDYKNKLNMYNINKF